MFINYLSAPVLRDEASLIDESHLADFLQFLADRGYASPTVRHYLKAVVHFEAWRRSQPKPCTSNPHDEAYLFVNHHLSHCRCSSPFPRSKIIAQAALKRWLLIAYPRYALTEDSSASDKSLLDSYEHYLSDVAGLSSATRLYRRRYADEFLKWLLTQSIPLDQLTVCELSQYIAVTATSKTSAHRSQRASSLKNFVNFLGIQQIASITWNPSLPRPKSLHTILSSRTLNEEELKRLLGAFNCDDPVGKRDYAMARCLVDLGVRTSDVARLSLDQIDWRYSKITLAPGKSRRQRSLPLPVETAAALVDYVRCARPITQERQVFVYHRAPLGKGVQASTVRCALRRAFARADFSASESQVHRLRHTVATRLLHNGLPLKTIADVLGHLSINTTIRYTHVDRPLLTAVSMPWPLRAQS